MKKGWFGKAEEEFEWEKWVINVNIQFAKSESEHSLFQSGLKEQLTNCLFYISSLCCENKNHIPPITSQDGNPFPFKVKQEIHAKITIPGISNESWAKLLKKMITETPPGIQAMTEKSDLTRAAKDFTAGWIGGMAQVLSGQPFDTIKVRLQTQSTAEGPLQCLQRTLKTEGIAGLYRGTLTPLLGVGLCVSVQFSAYEGMKRFFKQGKDSQYLLSNSELFLAGAVSGTANSVIAGPIEHVRIRLQIQDPTKKVFKGPLCVVKNLLGTHGLKGLFHAQSITVLREFFGYGCYFAAYEYLAQQARAASPTGQLAPWQVIAFGAMAGYAFWLPSFPIDVVKSKMQADSLSSPRYKGALDCARQTFREGGVKAFFKGFTPCFLRAAPVNAATFVAFEWAIKMLG